MRADLLCFRNWGVDTLSLNQCDNINYFESTINARKSELDKRHFNQFY